MVNLNVTSAHVREVTEALDIDLKSYRITTEEFREASNKLVLSKYEKRFIAFSEGQFNENAQ